MPLFTFRGNPAYTGYSPSRGPLGAGYNITFTGVNFDVGLDNPVIQICNQTATVTFRNFSTLIVELPVLDASCIPSDLYQVVVSIAFGTYDLSFPYQLCYNPTISDFTPNTGSITGNDTLFIEGTDMSCGGTPIVSIGGVLCNVTVVGDSLMKVVTNPSSPTSGFPIVLSLGYATATSQATFSYVQSGGLANWVIPVVCVIGGLILIIICVAFFMVRRQKLKGHKKAAMLFEELDKANETHMNVLSEVMEAYTEYNTRGKFSNPLFNDKPIPLTTFEVYALQTLFPVDDSLNPPASINFSAQSKALQEVKAFKQMLLKEEFSIIFFKAMEQQSDFKLADRKYSAALFMIGLRTEIGHATNVLFALLRDYIAIKVKSGEQKTILRATSTATEKMLTAWLSFTLHDHISENVAKPLFALFMAVKSQIEKGAVDCITGSSQYTINASTILRQKVPYDRIKVRAQYLDKPAVEIEVNTCDSISQVIANILFTFGENNKTVAQQVALTDGEGRQLKDIDGTNEKDADWVKINTVSHYNLKEGAELKLAKKTGQDSQAVPHVYHLEKKAENDPDQRIAPSEVFFTRMMTMREFIHPQVDALFEAIFDVRDTPPVPIKILFDFLDRTAKDLGIEDQETVHIWKNNSLALRFWVNLIANVNLLFEVNKTIPIHNCLSTIGQVLMDSCSLSEAKLGPGAPASKLLYKNEVDEYRQLVGKYYQHVKSAPAIDRPSIPVPQATGERLDENSALYELRNYGKKYQQPVSDALAKEKKEDLKASFQECTQAQ